MKTNLLKTTLSNVAKNSPTILTGLSVTGVVGSIVLGADNTIKALEILKEVDPNNEMTKKEKIKTTWKCYTPTMIMSGVTIACIIGSNSISSRRNAALAGLYSLSKTALSEYQAKVVEKIGTTKHKEIKDEIIKDKLKRDPASKHEVILGKGEILCFNALDNRYFYSDRESIKAAINKVNRDMMTDMFSTLNDLYSELDIDRSKLGDLVGWYIDDGNIEPDFSSQLSDDGRPCLVLDFYTPPRYVDRDF